jgi:hypothetical protein
LCPMQRLDGRQKFAQMLSSLVHNGIPFLVHDWGMWTSVAVTVVKSCFFSVLANSQCNTRSR